MDNVQHSSLHTPRQAPQSDAEMSASHVQELFIAVGETAPELCAEVAAGGNSLLAAFTAAADVAEDALTMAKKAEEEVQAMTKSFQQSEGLANLQDHFKRFRIEMAYIPGFSSQGALPDRLQFERKKIQKPTHMELEAVLRIQRSGLSMQLWNEVSERADAVVLELYQCEDKD